MEGEQCHISLTMEFQLSTKVQLPVWVWDGVFMGFVKMLVEDFCCLVVVFKGSLITYKLLPDPRESPMRFV